MIVKLKNVSGKKFIYGNISVNDGEVFDANDEDMVNLGGNIFKGVLEVVDVQDIIMEDVKSKEDGFNSVKSQRVKSKKNKGDN